MCVSGRSATIIVAAQRISYHGTDCAGGVLKLIGAQHMPERRSLQWELGATWVRAAALLSIVKAKLTLLRTTLATSVIRLRGQRLTITALPVSR